jgi:hypothetical protein
MPLSPAQLAWLRAEHRRLHAQYYDRPHVDSYSDGSTWGALCCLVRLMQAFGIPIDPDRISPAEQGWAREALKHGLF